MEMRRLQPLNELIDRITALENAMRTGTPPTQSGTPSPAGGSAPRSTSGSSRAASSGGRSATTSSEPPAKPEARTNGSAAIKWATEPETSAGNEASSDIDRLKDALQKRRKSLLVTALEGARLANIEGDELYVEFAPDAKHLRSTLANEQKVIRDACTEVLGKEIGLRIIVKDTEANDSLPLSREEEERRDQQSLRESAEQNPTVQHVLRKFRGEIVDVQRGGRSDAVGG